MRLKIWGGARMRAGARAAVAAGAGLVCVCTAAQAQSEDAETSAEDVQVMEELLVSGGRTPIAVDEVGRAFTVITGQELERRQIRYVADALRQVPGVAVNRSGSFGGLTQIRVRGGEGNAVLVLIDGVEVSAISGGEFDFGGLTSADIDRIEVLRGPQSALYGSNAASGVISIITKGGRRNALETSIALEGGTDATGLFSGAVRGGGEIWDGALSLAHRRTGGFDVSTIGGGERDGDSNITLNAKASVDPLDSLSIDGSFRFVTRDSETDGFDFTGGPLQGFVIDADSENDQTEIFAALSAAATPFAAPLTLTSKLEFSDVNSASLTDGIETFESRGFRFHASQQASYAFDTPGFADARHVVTLAGEIEREVNEPSTGALVTEDQVRDLFGIVGEYRGDFFDVISLQAGARNDRNDAFENSTTFSVASSVRHPRTGTRLHGSVGTGVVNPTFFEQFGSSPGLFIGNPDLEPEQTFGWDVGVEQTLLGGKLVVDATYFRATVTDEIVSGFNAAAGLPTSVNADFESEAQGVELAVTAQPLENLTLVGAYTYTLSIDGGTQTLEVRRPRHAAGLKATYAFLDGRARVGADVTYTGDNRDSDFTVFFTNGFSAGVATLDDYVRLDLTGAYQLTDAIEITARVENATDASYEEVFNFRTQGAAGFLGLRAKF
ncbi:MAG: TonB-dependent receptor [Pseudomonadota bacterium]